MKILLDHNLDRRLKSCLSGHETATTQEQGWADVVNGKLLDLAEQHHFDVLLTADSNIKDQQNLTGRTISILVIRAYNNRLSTHSEMMDEVLSTLFGIGRGKIKEVLHKDMVGKLRD